MEEDDSRLWGPAEGGSLSPMMERVTSTLAADRRTWAEDIKTSAAYARALQEAGLLKASQADRVTRGLLQVRAEWSDGAFVTMTHDSSVHAANDRRLGELVGAEDSAALRAGRSCNDRGATNLRLWVVGAASILRSLLRELVQTLCSRAAGPAEADVLVPGYTHLQRAQPVRWSHWLLHHAWFLCGDMERLHHLAARADVMPLAGGCPFPLDREALAAELGFSRCSPNAMAAVGDRDFAAELVHWSALSSVHLSQIAADLLLYSSSEFGFVTIADAYCTGSGLLPHKRNAVGLEHVRAKAARTVGLSAGLLITLKALPSSFCADLHEITSPLFEAYDTLCACMQLCTGTLLTLTLRPERCAQALSSDLLAADVTAWLVKAPRRASVSEARSLTRAVTEMATQRGCPLASLTLPDLKTVSPLFSQSVLSVLSFENSVDQYRTEGSTSKESVQSQLEKIEAFMKTH